jgi:hypothetical protein
VQQKAGESFAKILDLLVQDEREETKGEKEEAKGEKQETQGEKEDTQGEKERGAE